MLYNNIEFCCLKILNVIKRRETLIIFIALQTIVLSN